MKNFFAKLRVKVLPLNNMIKYVIFDFDGTIVDSAEFSITLFNQLAEKHKFKKVEEDDVDLLKRMSIIERCKYLNVPIYKIPRLATELYSLYHNSIEKVIPVDGMKDLFTELKQKGYKLAIISSNSEKNIRTFLKRHQIEDITDILDSNNIFGKDRVIKKFLNTYNLKTKEVIYVGDERRDIIASKKSGVKIIWVGWGFDAVEMAVKQYPDYIVNKPKEILACL